MRLMNASAVILAGGASSRMGRDKAWVEQDGQPLIARALSTIRGAGVQEVFISGLKGTDYSSLACPVLFDSEPGRGPLTGIERALEAVNGPLLLVLAVDLPNMTGEFLSKLVACCEPLTGVVPKVRGQLEPLAAIYPRRCRWLVRDCLHKGQLVARDFADLCLRERTVKTMAVDEIDFSRFDNWNTPADVASPDAMPVRMG